MKNNYNTRMGIFFIVSLIAMAALAIYGFINYPLITGSIYAVLTAFTVWCLVTAPTINELP